MAGQCSFCKNEESEMEDARVMPCNHIGCFLCLKTAYEEHPDIKCQICSNSFSPATLHDIECLPRKDKPLCDPCSAKHVKVASEWYCAKCERHFCTEHRKTHEDIFGVESSKHKVISIHDYERNKAKLTQRLCPNHDELPIDGMCMKCETFACMKCISYDKQCPKGGHHEHRELRKVEKDNIEQIKMLLRPLYEKQSSFDSLQKSAEQDFGSYQEKGNEMLRRADVLMEEQIDQLRVLWSSLKNTLQLDIQKAETGKDHYKRELEGKMKRIKDLMNRSDSLITQSHAVDLIKGTRRLCEDLEQAATITHPKYVHQEMMLMKKEITQVITAGLQPVPSIKFMEQKGTLPYCFSMCHTDDGRMIWGGDKRLEIRESSGDNTVKSINVSGTVWSLNSQMDLLYYCVGSSEQHTMNVFDMRADRVIHSWKVWRESKLAVVDNKVFVSDPENKQIVCFDKSGERMFTIKEPSFSYPTHLCALPPNNIVVADTAAKAVYMIDISSKTIVWTYVKVEKAKSVCADSSGLIFVCQGKKILILSSEGNLIKTLNDDNLQDEDYQISVWTNQLALGRKNLWLYKLSG